VTLRMLLDEDSQAKYLVNLLKAAGYDVLTGNEACLTKRLDSFVLNYAIADNRVLLTRNCADFLELHRLNPVHAGIIAVYQDADPNKNMSYQSIVKAIVNIQTAEYVLENQFIILNQWNY
jgi:predicted nuclease of predicted toxin-antitoxin system